jgi:adenylosuccinate lyase
MICECCQEDKEEYVSNLCKECSDKMDDYFKKRIHFIIESSDILINALNLQYKAQHRTLYPTAEDIVKELKEQGK